MKSKQNKTGAYRPTWVEIELSAIRFNLGRLRKVIPKHTKILVAVKADAYGHGIVEVSKELVRLGVDYLGVATTDEAITLRLAGVRIPILVFGSVLKDEIEPIIEYNITPTISRLETARLLSKAAAKLKKKMTKVHVKIDTGMGRLGVWHSDAIGFVKSLLRFKNLKIDGIYSHLPSADEKDKKFTNMQFLHFESLICDLERLGISIRLRHIANSMGLLRFKKSHLNLVRPGLMIYGLYPDLDSPRSSRLRPVLSFKTRIVYIKELPRGRSVSYGRTYVTSKKSKVATLPVGYGDGYPRFLSNKAYVLVKGKKARVIGTVCMDQTMIDVSNIKGAKVQDEVVLIGAQGGRRITAEELAKLGNTISYEIVCMISKRVPRSYENKCC